MSARGRFDAEERVALWAARSMVAYGALLIISDLVLWTEAGAWKRYIGAVHQDFRSIRDHVGTPGYVAPSFPATPHGYWIGFLGVIPGIIFLVWQLRAAETARALGYPARHTPGWGVGAWFVPLVNLWIPYGAIRDCLPPGHPRRARLWVPWVLYLCSSALTAGLILALAEIRSVGLALLAVTVVLYAYLFARGRQLVVSVTEDHRNAVNEIPSQGRWRPAGRGGNTA